MIITKIYEKYFIPINLQQHMLRVAGVSKLVCDNFKVEIDSDLIIKTMLLHDMGNIIKFKLDGPSFLVDEDVNRIDDLKIIQEEFKTRYGHDADSATSQIIDEISDDPRLIILCEWSHGENAEDYIGSDEYDKQLSYYSDMRVGPYSVVPLHTRFDDLKVRYNHIPDQLEEFRNYALHIEQQLQEKCTIDIRGIDEGMVEKEFEYLQKIEIY